MATKKLNSGGGKLKIRQLRTFSESFKRQKVKELVSRQLTVSQMSTLYGISIQTVYRWLYKYSPDYKRGTIQVVQMESEAQKTKLYQERVAELERIIGQKQMEIDYLQKLLEVSSKELGVDIKKNFDTKRSTASENEVGSTPTK